MTDLATIAFLAMMTGLYSPVSPPNGLTDSFANNSGADWALSQNIYYEQARTMLANTRTRGAGILHEPFDDISAWSQIRTATATVAVDATDESDPAVGAHTLDLQTGAGVGSVAGLQRNVGSVPSSFGILFIPKLINVGTDLLDALNIWTENVDNKSLRIRLNDGALSVQVNGQWTVLSTLVAAYPGLAGPEWWVQVNSLGDGQYTISAYAGTELKGSATGTLPNGTGNNGLVQITQQSVHTANRHSQLAILDIGATQLPDDMALVSTAKTATFAPSMGCIALAVEDVSVVLDPNVNFFASLSNDDGQTWQRVTLSDAGPMGKGEIGTEKWIHLLTGCVTFPANGGQAIRYKVETVGGGYYVLQNATAYWQ